jgi:hypothetical protein
MCSLKEVVLNGGGGREEVEGEFSRDTEGDFLGTYKVGATALFGHQPLNKDIGKFIFLQ